MSDDLFQKADALLGRYRGDARPEPDFPVLTEVVETLPAPAAQTSPGAPATPMEPPLYPGEADLEAMRARLLERLQPDIEALVSAAVEAGRVQLEDQMRLAVHQSLADAEAEIQERLRERLEAALREAFGTLRR